LEGDGRKQEVDQFDWFRWMDVKILAANDGQMGMAQWSIPLPQVVSIPKDLLSHSHCFCCSDSEKAKTASPKIGLFYGSILVTYKGFQDISTIFKTLVHRAFLQN
jgi:hypothetical protein